MEHTYLCPKCRKELERIVACGSESYFCNNCKELVSRSKMIKVEDNKE